MPDHLSVDRCSSFSAEPSVHRGWTAPQVVLLPTVRGNPLVDAALTWDIGFGEEAFECRLRTRPVEDPRCCGQGGTPAAARQTPVAVRWCHPARIEWSPFDDGSDRRH